MVNGMSIFTESPIMRWREYEERYHLKGYQCTKCLKVYFEKKGVCTCNNMDYTEKELSGKGKILAYTQINGAPEAYADYAPYCVALIELEEGARIESQVVDCAYADLKIGTPVEAVFRKFYKSGHKGIIHYGTKFIPTF